MPRAFCLHSTFSLTCRTIIQQPSRCTPAPMRRTALHARPQQQRAQIQLAHSVYADTSAPEECIAATDRSNECSTSCPSHDRPTLARGMLRMARSIAAGVGFWHLLPAVACAAEAAPAGFLQFVLDGVLSMGPWAPVVFILTVTIAESIPLLPTQPLSLASGLLFGPKYGACFMLIGTTMASLVAFAISRGIGRPLAEAMVAKEVGDKEHSSLIAKTMTKVTKTIEQGNFWQQCGAVAALRLTPIIPFSGSNYILGLTPINLGAYVSGTVAGMTVWSIAYASLGGASRSLLLRGVNPDVLLADLLDKAGELSETAATTALAAGIVALLVWLVRRHKPDAGQTPSRPSEAMDSPLSSLDIDTRARAEERT